MSRHDKPGRHQGGWQQEGFNERDRQRGGQESSRFQRGFGQPDPAYQRADQEWQRDDAPRDQGMRGRYEELPPGRGPDDWYGSNNPSGLGRGSHPARSDDVHEMRPYPAGRLGARMTNDISNYRRDYDRSDQNDHSVFDHQRSADWRGQDDHRDQRGSEQDARTRGFRQGGYGGYGLQRSEQEAFDPDYHQWRREQMETLDNDYRAFRQERFKTFSDDFSSWRTSRSQQRAQPSNDAVTTGTSSGPATDHSAAQGAKTDKDK